MDEISKKAENKNLIAGLIVILIVIFVIYMLAVELMRLVPRIIDSTREFLDGMTTLDAAINVALISGAVAVVGIVVNSVVQIRLKKLEFKYARSEKMESAYQKLVDMYFVLIPKMGDKVKNKSVEAQFQKAFDDFNRSVVMYGSNKVIKKWIKVRGLTLDENPKKRLFLMEEVLYEIRRDLGFKKGFMRKADLLKLNINDVESLR